jgi:hypothetical protein
LLEKLIHGISHVEQESDLPLEDLMNQAESSPNVIPEVCKRKKEEMREEMFRRSTQPKDKHKSRKPGSDLKKSVPPAPQHWKSPSGNRELAEGTFAIDLNDADV